ncbi:Insulinase (Peptidase M16), partial [Gamsiella multidivaricata]
QLEPHPELHFPVPNEYIPKNFETGKVPTPSPLSHPVLVKHTPLARLWHKKDDVFWIPRAHLCFLLRSPMMTMSPSHQARSMLYVELVKDALNEEAYNAEQAGLYYSLSCTIDGVVLKVEGYNDKAHLLLQKIIRTMKTLTIDSGPFWRLKEQMERNLRNSNLSNPNVLAKYYMRYLHQEKMWTYLERLDELEPITPESLQQFYPEMLDRLHIEGLVHGNIDQAQALSIAEIVENGLAPRPLVPSELISLRSLTVPEGCRAVYERDSMDPKNLNSGVDYYVQIEIPASRPELARRTERAVVQILAQIIQEPCFSQLRTIEQLGYIVQSGIHCPGGTHGIRISVQSERDPVHVENRIESFLTIRLATLLETMTEAAYRKQVQSLIKKKLEKDKNLKQETTRYWDQITSGYYDFEETQEDVKEIENITLDMTRIFFQRWVLPGSPQIKKVSVHIRSLNLPPSGEEKEGDELTLREGTEVVKDAVRFKAGLELSRAPYPIVDLLRYSKL